MSEMDDKCRTAFGGLRCKFEPRYDLSEPIFPNELNGTNLDIEQFRRKTYVCDVCVACGKTVKRP